jgi:LytS/YehU family sensor histidine kinase
MGHLSNLLRLTLELSKKEAVTLAEEIDYLKSYIELQSLRLNKTLDYCFDTSIDLKLSEIFIPPVLIQPIEENTILHGIIPYRSKGILVVGFKEIDQGVCITVEDNGIGVEKSKKTI